MATLNIGRRGNIRNDYNENHDERGRFSVSGDAGGKGTAHDTLKEAKSQAKTTSSMFDGTFHVREKSETSSHPLGKVVASFKGGQQLNKLTGAPRPSFAAKIQGNIDKLNSGTTAGRQAIKKEASRQMAEMKPHIDKALSTSVVGGHVPMNDKQFSRLVSKGSYTVLTPANPMSKALTPKENAYRMKEAAKDLTRMGAKFVITAGRYGNSEPGFTVIHDEKFGKEQARELGRKYNQTSVMHVEGGKATIYHTTGQFAGRVQRSTGFSFEPGARDNFTGRGAVKYSFHFPDESWTNPEKE